MPKWLSFLDIWVHRLCERSAMAAANGACVYFEDEPGRQRHELPTHVQHSSRQGVPRTERHFAAEAAHMLALRNRLESGLKAISPNTVVFGEAAIERFLAAGEGLQMHYVEGTVSPPKWLYCRTFSRPFEWFKRRMWGDRQRTNPSQNIAIADPIQPAVLETVSGGTNAGSARDRRAGPAHRRRSVQIRI